MLEQLQDPTDDFVRFFASKVYCGKLTQAVREQFNQLTKKAFKQVINDQINERLKSALVTEVNTPTQAAPDAVSPVATTAPSDASSGNDTSEEEWEGYHIVRAILREVTPPKRVALRDVQSYCGILLDDNNRKPICRLRFNAAQKYLSLFDIEKEERIPIEGLDDLYKHAERLKAAVTKYDTKAGAPKSTTP